MFTVWRDEWETDIPRDRPLMQALLVRGPYPLSRRLNHFASFQLRQQKRREDLPGQEA